MVKPETGINTAGISADEVAKRRAKLKKRLRSGMKN